LQIMLLSKNNDAGSMINNLDKSKFQRN